MAAMDTIIMYTGLIQEELNNLKSGRFFNPGTVVQLSKDIKNLAKKLGRGNEAIIMAATAVEKTTSDFKRTKELKTQSYLQNIARYMTNLRVAENRYLQTNKR